MALRTTNSREPSLHPPAVKKRLYRPHNHRAQRSGVGLETLLVSPHVIVKVSLKQLIKPCTLGMSRLVLGRRLAKQQPRLPHNGIIDLDRGIIRQAGWQTVPEHNRQRTSRGQDAAIDLTAGGRFEPDC